MFIKYFFSGFFVTIISGFDDTLTNVPVLATVTKTKKGKLFFSLGWLCSLFVNLVIVLIFSELLNVFSYTEYIVSGLIFLLAVVIYFDFLSFNKGKEKIKKKDIKIKKEQVSVKKLIKLAGFGFVIAFITSIDDMIAFLPLFIKGIEIKIY